VAKEFVAARDDEQGVLILSDFAGASRELSEALIVNPYDHQSLSEAIKQALLMSETEQRDRMQLMREVVRNRNVYRWAGQMLLDASQLRKRQKIMLMASQKPKEMLKDMLINGRCLGNCVKFADLGQLVDPVRLLRMVPAAFCRVFLRKRKASGTD